jgi:hypothetical protein
VKALPNIAKATVAPYKYRRPVARREAQPHLDAFRVVMSIAAST